MLGKLALGEVVTGEIVLGKLCWGNVLTPLKICTFFMAFLDFPFPGVVECRK